MLFTVASFMTPCALWFLPKVLLFLPTLHMHTNRGVHFRAHFVHAIILTTPLPHPGVRHITTWTVAVRVYTLICIHDCVVLSEDH